MANISQMALQKLFPKSILRISLKYDLFVMHEKRNAYGLVQIVTINFKTCIN